MSMLCCNRSRSFIYNDSKIDSFSLVKWMGVLNSDRINCVYNMRQWRRLQSYINFDISCVCVAIYIIAPHTIQFDRDINEKKPPILIDNQLCNLILDSFLPSFTPFARWDAGDVIPFDISITVSTIFTDSTLLLFTLQIYYFVFLSLFFAHLHTNPPKRVWFIILEWFEP